MPDSHDESLEDNAAPLGEPAGNIGQVDPAWAGVLDELAARSQVSESSAAEDPETETPEAESAAEAPAHPPLEPVSAWLLKVALALIVVLLATTLTLVIFLVTLHKAPRTEIERAVSSAEMSVREHPSVAENWAQLAYAYARAHRYDDALNVVRKGRAQTHQDYLYLAEADILRSAGRFKDSIAVYGSAEAAISQADTQAISARKTMGIYVPLDDTTLARVYVGRAISERQLGEAKSAIADLEKAVAIAPDQSTILVRLGDYYAESGDTSKAAGMYRSALLYLPDYAPAKAGLERIGRGQ